MTAWKPLFLLSRCESQVFSPLKKAFCFWLFIDRLFSMRAEIEHFWMNVFCAEIGLDAKEFSNLSICHENLLSWSHYRFSNLALCVLNNFLQNSANIQSTDVLIRAYYLWPHSLVKPRQLKNWKQKHSVVFSHRHMLSKSCQPFEAVWEGRRNSCGVFNLLSFIQEIQ